MMRLLTCIGILMAMMMGALRATLLITTIWGSSMAPTLCHGDRVLVLRRFHRRAVRTDCIVIVHQPGAPTNTGIKHVGSMPFIKRVIGLAGDMLALPDTTLILSEALTAESQATLPLRTWHIPPGHVFVRGDNPSTDVDSRRWGPVPMSNIVGVVLLLLSRRSESGEWTEGMVDE